MKKSGEGEKRDNVPLMSSEEQDGFLREWFSTCTIGRCEPAARSYFAGCGRRYFSQHAKDIEAENEAAYILQQQERAWLLFEEHMCFPGANGRKPFKEHLLSAAAKHDDVIRRVSVTIRYIANAFRAVVRQWVVREGFQGRDGAGRVFARTMSAYQTVEDDEVSIVDCLPAQVPDPSDEAQMALVREEAADAAAGILPRLTDPMRVALAAKAFGVSLMHPEVVAKAGRKGSQLALYLQHKKGSTSTVCIPAMLVALAEERLPEADEDQRAFFRGAALHCLLSDNETWLQRPENETFLRFLQDEGAQKV